MVRRITMVQFGVLSKKAGAMEPQLLMLRSTVMRLTRTGRADSYQDGCAESRAAFTDAGLSCTASVLHGLRPAGYPDGLTPDCSLPP